MTARLLALAWLTLSPEQPATHTTPGEYDLRWVAPDSCPPASHLRERLEALLSGPPIGHGTVVIDATVTQRGAMLHLDLRSRFLDREDKREFEAATCASLAEAAVVFLAIVLEPGLAKHPPSVATIPDPPASADALPAPAIPTPPFITTPPPPSVRRSSPGAAKARATPHPYVRLGAGPEYGTLDAITFEFTVSTGAAWSRWTLGIEARYLTPRVLPEATGPGALYQFLGAGPHACRRLFVSNLELPVCLGFDAGWIRAESRRLREPSVRHGFWTGPVATLGISGGRRVRGYANLQVGITVHGTRFLIDDVPAMTPFPVTFSLSGGLEINP